MDIYHQRNAEKTRRRHKRHHPITAGKAFIGQTSKHKVCEEAEEGESLLTVSGNEGDAAAVGKSSDVSETHQQNCQPHVWVTFFGLLNDLQTKPSAASDPHVMHRKAT